MATKHTKRCSVSKRLSRTITMGIINTTLISNSALAANVVVDKSNEESPVTNTITSSTDVALVGTDNKIDTANKTSVSGKQNTVTQSDDVNIIGQGNTVSNSDRQNVIGNNNTITKRDASTVSSYQGIVRNNAFDLVLEMNNTITGIDGSFTPMFSSAYGSLNQIAANEEGFDGDLANSVLGSMNKIANSGNSLALGAGNRINHAFTGLDNGVYTN